MPCKKISIANYPEIRVGKTFERKSQFPSGLMFLILSDDVIKTIQGPNLFKKE